VRPFKSRDANPDPNYNEYPDPEPEVKRMRRTDLESFFLIETGWRWGPTETKIRKKIAE